MNIIKTQPGDRHFHLFDDLIKQLYPVESIRHQQEDNFNREFLHGCYVLTKDEKPLARAALYNNPALCYRGMAAACIGNYECAEDKEMAEQLLDFVIQEGKKTGSDFIIGPMNGSTWDNYRFSAHHQSPNFLMEPYHHLYYNQQFLENGFEIISNYTSGIDKELRDDYPEVLKREQELEQMGVVIRSIRLDNYEAELEELYPFISNAFKSNFLYTPVSRETFFAKYMGAAKIIDPEFVLIAEDNQSHIIGFIFCYPDFFNTREKSLVIKTIARDPSEKWSGLGFVMANRVIRLIKSKEYQSVVHAFMLDQADSVHLSRKFSGTVYKNYHLYGLAL